MKARRARLADVGAIHTLISHYASQGLLLPRAEDEIRRHAGHFLVLEEGGKVIGCVALESYGADLAEVRSLAVDPATCGRGLGERLLRYVLATAKRRKIARVFAVTHAPGFFGGQGFVASTRWALPEKIARDCRTCPKAQNCELVAVIATVMPERVALPILEAKPAPAV
jgi:N-acetylglutamate synthase-like GNAT family acetyltransferase